MTIQAKFGVSGKRLLVTCAAILMVAVVSSSGAVASVDTSAAAGDRDGQHDFDWEIGTWRTDVRVLAEPLSDSPDEWLRFAGTSVVKPLMDRKANVVELSVSGSAGSINGLNLRLYEPQGQRWSSTFANLRDGMLTPSVYGSFERGVGTFYGDDQLDGTPIRVRFLVIRQGPDRARFEQAFSADGGHTWETNWIAVDTRLRHGR